MRSAIVGLVLLAAAMPAPGEDLGFEESTEWRSFEEAHGRYREFHPAAGWMDTTPEERVEFERRGAAVGEAIRGLAPLVERGLLDEAAIRLIQSAWPRRFGPQFAAQTMEDAAAAAEAYERAEAREAIDEVVDDLERHVATGPYVAWLDRNLFARLREAVRLLEASGEGTSGGAIRARAALWDGVFRQRIARVATPGEDEHFRKRIEELGSDSFEVRSAAHAALLAAGDGALAALLEASRDRDPEVARRAAEIALALLPEPID